MNVNQAPQHAHVDYAGLKKELDSLQRVFKKIPKKCGVVKLHQGASATTQKTHSVFRESKNQLSSSNKQRVGGQVEIISAPPASPDGKASPSDFLSSALKQLEIAVDHFNQASSDLTQDQKKHCIDIFNKIVNQSEQVCEEIDAVNLSSVPDNVSQFFHKAHSTAMKAQPPTTGKKPEAQQQLFDAIRKNDTKGILQALKKGADLNGTDEDGNNPLQIAINETNSSICKFLLESKFPQGKKIDVAHVNKDGSSALHLAAQYGLVDISRLLVKTGADINQENQYGWNSLEIAIFNKNAKVATYLLSADLPEGTKPDLRHAGGKYKESALHLAVQEGLVDVIELLIDAGADINQPDYKGRTALHYAASSGRVDVFKMLVEKGADINQENQNGWNSLEIAIFSKNAEIVKYLLSADLPEEIRPDLTHVGKDKMSALHLAAKHGLVDLFEMLVKQGLDINQENEYGWNSLEIAIFSKNAEIAKYLLGRRLPEGVKIDLTHKGKDGSSALHLAAQHGLVDLIDLLIDAGANINQPDDKGWTPLHYAASYGKVECFKKLIDRGVNPHIVSHQGDTGLNLFLARRPDPVLADKLPFSLNRFSNQQVNETLTRKLLSHAFEVKGNSPFVLADEVSEAYRLDLEGSLCEHFWNRFATSFKEDGCNVPGSFDQQAVNILSTASQFAADSATKTCANMLETWKRGEPLVVHAGYSEHHVSLVFYKDHYVLCNRGGGSGFQNGHVYDAHTFDTNLLTESVLQKILDMRSKSEKEFVDFFSKALPSLLKFSQTDVDKKLEKMDVPFQTVGNCSYANSEGLVLPIMVLEKCLRENDKANENNVDSIIKSEFQTYESWRSHVQLTIVEDYLEMCQRPNRALVPDFNLLSTSIQKGIVLAKKVNNPEMLARWNYAQEQFLSLASPNEKGTYMTHMVARYSLAFVSMFFGSIGNPVPIEKQLSYLGKALEDLIDRASCYQDVEGRRALPFDEGEVNKLSQRLKGCLADPDSERAVKKAERILADITSRLRNMGIATTVEKDDTELARSFDYATKLLNVLKDSSNR